jgi:hypothetical protein
LRSIITTNAPSNLTTINIESQTTGLWENPTSSSNSDVELSTGTKAGVATGAVIGLFILFGLGFMAWRNKQKVGKLQSRLLSVNKNGQDLIVPSPYKDTDTFKQTVTNELEPCYTLQELP